MKKNELGQVLPLGLVLVVLSVVGCLMLFNTSQVASDKMRLANSADAAAYSGALWQARALNYQAYANRALVANQVAIAQAVSLHSWMTYAAMTSQNLATALKLVPVLNTITSGIDGAVAVAEKVVIAGANAMLIASNAATMALSLSQNAMQAATLYNTEELISVVAKETDSRFTTNSAYGLAATAANISQWWDFSTRHKKRDTAAMLERKQLIMASRDEFTRERNWDLFKYWIPSSFTKSHNLRRQGTTQLLSVKTPRGLEWEWVAKDTLSIHTRRFKWSGTNYKELPVAWASAFANSRGSTKPINLESCGRRITSGFNITKCSNFTADNHKAEKYADISVPTLLGKPTRIPMKGYGGVRPFWVLSDKARSAEDARLTIRVEVSLPALQVRDSDTIVAGDQLSSPLVVAGNTLSSLSFADVFYRQPQFHAMDKSQHEKANAYNPYWQAQLSPVNQTERVAAALTRSGSIEPTLVGRSSGKPSGLHTYGKTGVSSDRLDPYPETNTANQGVVSVSVDQSKDTHGGEK